MVSEALFALELDIGVRAPTGVPAAKEPAAAVAAASATEPAAAERERPELTDEPAAAPREYWVLNSAVDPKVILKKAFEATDSPVVTASEPRPPMAAAASVKRKAKAEVTGGSQKRKKSSPAEAKDL